MRKLYCFIVVIVITVFSTISTTAQHKLTVQAVKPSQKEEALQIVAAENVMDYNTIENPKKVYPVEKIINVSGSNFDIALEKESFTVLKIKNK